jgi:hypothetical protein
MPAPPEPPPQAAKVSGMPAMASPLISFHDAAQMAALIRANRWRRLFPVDDTDIHHPQGLMKLGSVGHRDAQVKYI